VRRIDEAVRRRIVARIALAQLPFLLGGLPGGAGRAWQIDDSVRQWGTADHGRRPNHQLDLVSAKSPTSTSGRVSANRRQDRRSVEIG
jgi:hypothetical protein